MREINGVVLLMRMIKLFAVFIVVLTLVACSKEPSTIEQAMKESNISFDKLVHVKEIKDGNMALVYYEKDEGLGIGLVERNRKGWTWEIGKSPQLDKNDDLLTWSYTSLNGDVPMFHGVINNESINRVVIETNSFTKEAEIVQGADGIKLWMVLLDKPQNPPVRIQAYNKLDEVVYSSE